MAKTKGAATSDDVIDAMDELRHSIDGLAEKIGTLESTAENLFNAFDPKHGETLKQLLDAAKMIAGENSAARARRPR